MLKKNHIVYPKSGFEMNCRLSASLYPYELLTLILGAHVEHVRSVSVLECVIIFTIRSSFSDSES